MAKQLKVDLKLQGDGVYSCSSVKNYTDQFTINQQVTNSDAFTNLIASSKDPSAASIHSAKALLIKNTGNTAAEIQIKTFDWKNSSDIDVRNPVDVGGGGATSYRMWSFLLPANDFIFLPNSRVLSYSPNVIGTLESAALASDGTFAVEPKDVNSGNEYNPVTDPTDDSAELVNDASIAVHDTTITVDEASYFLVGDKLRLSDEIVKVVSISGEVLTVERGLDGSTAAAEADDSAINWAFHNEHLRYDVGKCITTTGGRFKQSGGFFGQSCRTSTGIADGLVAGSVAIGPFYSEGGYLDWGLSGIRPSTDTGLTASTAYAFDLVLDEYNFNGKDTTATEATISFTTDSSDVTFAGSSNAVLPKIQAQLDAYFYDEASGLKNKKVTIGIHKGDVRVTSHSNHSDTIVGISKSTSGTTPFSVGRFPTAGVSKGANIPDLEGSAVGGGATDSIVYGSASSLAPETIDDRVTGKTITNENAFILDNGQGDLLFRGSKVGWIDYEKGHLEFTHLPNAEFKIYGQSHSAHSGGISYTNQGYNSIQEIKAKSVNIKDNAKLKVILLG